MNLAVIAACGSRAAPPLPVPARTTTASSAPPRPAPVTPAFEREDFDGAAADSLPAGWRVIGHPKGLIPPRQAASRFFDEQWGQEPGAG
jgi:hypothetical protein